MKTLEVFVHLYKNAAFFLWSRETHLCQSPLPPELGGLGCSLASGSYKSWGALSEGETGGCSFQGPFSVLFPEDKAPGSACMPI